MSEHPLASVSDNPMLGEVRRHGRRFLNHGNRAVNRVSLGIIGVAYVGILMLVISAHGDVPAFFIVSLQTVLGMFIAPISMQGVIAGEREKRTWDMLLVAPISRRDIVVGKFGASMFTFGLVLTAAVIPTILTAALGTATNWGFLLAAELVSFSLITLVASLTLYFSARNSRPIAALGATLATLTGVFVVAPSIFISFFQRVIENQLLELLLGWHPVTILLRLIPAGDGVMIRGGVGSPVLQAILASILYLGISAWLVRRAIRAVEKIDPEVGPMKRGRRA